MRKIGLGFMLLCFLQLGISAPQGEKGNDSASATSKKTKTEQSFSMAGTPQSVGDQIVKYFGRKTGKELMAEKAGSVKAKKRSSSKVGTSDEKKSSAEVAQASKVSPVTKSNFVPPPPTPRASVPQIRQEIQKILELNKQIKNVQGGRSVQLQRVQEQARIHQKILNDLENSQKVTAGQKVPVKTALLAQEKVRIIHEETQRNTQMVEALKTISPSSTPKVTSKVKTAVS